jgi:hypothetical protein
VRDAFSDGPQGWIGAGIPLFIGNSRRKGMQPDLRLLEFDNNFRQLRDDGNLP